MVKAAVNGPHTTPKDVASMSSKSIAHRLASKIYLDESGCWLWTGAS